MKILHVVRSVDPRDGGPIEGVKLLGRAHHREGREVEVVSLDDPDAEWVRNFPLRVYGLGPVGTKYGYTSKLPVWLKSHAANYDAVIVNGVWQFGGLAAWRALRDTATPYYVFPHGMLDPWFKRTYPLKHLKKWFYWPWAEYRVLRDARAVFFTCEQERLLARESFWLYRCTEVVLGYGTSQPPGDAAAQRQKFFQAFPHCQEKRLWLFLGRLHVKKGCDDLLEAFALSRQRDPSLHLVMAGPDQTGWQAKLQSQTHKLGLDSHVTWPGMLDGDLKWGALHAAEVFFLPSHQENFGIAVAEALACGVPVLISNKVNIWREIEEDGAGLVADDSVAGTHSNAERWLNLSAPEQASMRVQARACFHRHYHIEQVAARLAEHLRLLGARG